MLLPIHRREKAACWMRSW